jgi:hypothetical protein
VEAKPALRASGLVMRKTRWVAAAAVVGLTGAHFVPLLFTHAEQDACSFGTVSNEEYRALLGKARASLGRWRPFQTWSGEGVSLQLSRKYQELLPDAPSSAMKIAVAHALLRSLGADFRYFTGGKAPAPDAKLRSASIYYYLLDVNRLFYFSLFPRDMLVIVSFHNPPLAESEPDARSELRITVHLPNLIEWRPVDRGPSTCPPIPSI